MAEYNYLPFFNINCNIFFAANNYNYYVNILQGYFIFLSLHQIKYFHQRDYLWAQGQLANKVDP